MNALTVNEIKTLLKLLKDFNRRYNANNLSKEINLTPMGTLKILKKLEQQKLLISEELGKARFYSINISQKYTQIAINFLLRKECQEANPKIKRWINELEKLKPHTEIIILFGSVLTKKEYQDVDILIVLNNSQLKKANQTIKEINNINIKKIHAVKQTKYDIIRNVRKKHEILLEALKKGLVLSGYEKYIEMINDVTYKQQSQMVLKER